MVECRLPPVQDSEASLSALLSATQDGVVFIDREGKITRANGAACRMFGYAEGELIGAKVNVLMAERFAQEHDGYLTQYLGGGAPKAIGRIRTVSGKRRSGTEFPLELSVSEFPEGGASRFAAFLRDITDKVNLQAELVARERLATVGATASMLAHEIGNPLNNLYLHAQLMQKRLERSEAPDPRVVEALRTSVSEISRLTRLLDEFRSHSRTQRLQLSPINLTALAEEVLDRQLGHRFKSAVRVERELSGALPTVSGDPDKLKQVILNLYQNALDAMPDGGTLTVRTCATPESVSLDVVDTGLGVPAGVEIFEPFVTTKHEGTGLGLTISREIVVAHGGELSLESTSNSGSTFRVSLRRAHEDDDDLASTVSVLQRPA